MNHGSVEESIVRQAIKNKDPIPDKILNSPELTLGLELYWQAFFELNDSRDINFTLSPISWLVIRQYCVYNKLSSFQTEAMHYHIKNMDSVYLSHAGKK